MLDQRGHGRSGRPASGYGLERFAADAHRVIAALDLGRPLVVGHGWGGLVALELCVRRPEAASGLVFVDGPLFDGVGTAPPPRGAMPTHASPGDAEAELRAGLGEPLDRDVSDLVRAGLVERQGRFLPVPTARVRRLLQRAMRAARPGELLGEVQVPALLALSGARRDEAELIEARAPAALVRWYDCGHEIPLLRPARLGADISRMAVAAAYADVAWRAAQLDGNWSMTVHDGERGWDARQLLAHIASTQTAIPQLLRLDDAHRVGAPFDPDRWNEAQVRRRRTATPKALKEELQAASEAMPSAILAADPRRPAVAGPFAGRPLSEMLDRTLRHQIQHLVTLQKAFGACPRDGAGLSADLECV